MHEVFIAILVARKVVDLPSVEKKDLYLLILTKIH